MKKKLRHPLGGRGTGAKRREQLRWLQEYRASFQHARHGRQPEVARDMLIEAVKKWGYGTVKRLLLVRHNPDVDQKGDGLYVKRGLGGWFVCRGSRELEGPFPTERIAEGRCAWLGGKKPNPRPSRLGQRYHVGEETMLGPGGRLVEPLSESSELTFVIEILRDAMKKGLAGGASRDVSVAVATLQRLKEQVMHGFHRNPRRQARNPPMVVLGANPPGSSLRAKWARIEYCRPDDPAGKKVARVHDFPAGFVAHGLADGSVLLRHPKGRRLWTRS